LRHAAEQRFFYPEILKKVSALIFSDACDVQTKNSHFQLQYRMQYDNEDGQYDDEDGQYDDEDGPFFNDFTPVTPRSLGGMGLDVELLQSFISNGGEQCTVCLLNMDDSNRHQIDFHKFPFCFECFFCTDVFSGFFEFLVHLERYHGGGTLQSFICCSCCEEFRCRGDLNLHFDETSCVDIASQTAIRFEEEFNTLEDTMHCIQCKKRMHSSQEYDFHLERHHPPGSIANLEDQEVQCYFCYKIIEVRRYVEHMIKEHCERKFHCPKVCGRTWSEEEQEDLYLHLIQVACYIPSNIAFGHREHYT